MINYIRLLVLSMSLGASLAMAADQGQMARMQQVLRQLGMEKQQLTDQVAQLQKENTEFKAANGKLEAKVKSLEQHVDRSTKANEAAVQRIDQFNARLKDTVTKLHDSVMELHKAEMVLNDQKEQVTACMRMNVQLYDAGKDLLTKYEKKGVWDALAQREPFTGLKQVEIENVIEEYRYKIDGLTVPKQAEKQILDENQTTTSAVQQAQRSGRKTIDAITPLLDEGKTALPAEVPAMAR
ncbi:MAG: hypothetical protein HY080_02925 [Gammaproteobacteria bacterium]|nr:hypothetical protein [Gammaproteobacteria bacterium]